MNNRFRRATYLFNRPFRLGSSGETHAAGAYLIETEEEMVDGLSSPAYRHVAMTMVPQGRALWEPIPIYRVNRNELADAIASSGSCDNVPQISPWETTSSQG